MKLRIENLTKIYSQGETKVKAVDHLNFVIKEGEFVAIVGDSGSGKSTLLNLIGGLLDATSGDIYIDQLNVTKMNRQQQAYYRRNHIGFIFQSYNLVEFLNVYENIVLPIKLENKMVNQDELDHILEQLGISDKLNYYPDSLSGGEKQRVAIARALLMKPDIILADEPTGSLDSENSMKVFELLKSISLAANQTVIFVTHNRELSKKCDKILRLKDGKILS